MTQVSAPQRGIKQAGDKNAIRPFHVNVPEAELTTPTDAESKNVPTSGRLFFLDLGAGRILSANSDGSVLKTIVNEGRKLPDGLVLDVAAGHIYWPNPEAQNRIKAAIKFGFQTGMRKWPWRAC